MTSEQTPGPSAEANERRPLLLLLPLLPIATVLAVWYFADLSRFNSVDKVTEAVEALREDPAAFAYVLLAFAIGTLVFFPVTMLITGTVLAFEPLRGFGLAFGGTLLGACLTYGVGRMLGSHTLDYVSGPRLMRFGSLMRQHAIRATIAARLLPIGNFTGLNLFAGSLRIPFRRYFVGNMIGILPGVLFLTLFADTLSAAVRAPSWRNLTVLGAIFAVMLAGLWLIRRRGKRRTEAASTREGTA